MNTKNIHFKFYTALAVFISCIVALKVMGHYFAVDTYFMLSSGRDIIRNGIPYDNPFFVLPGYHLVVQQWAYDVILYIVYSIAGNAGMFCMALSGAAFCSIAMYLTSRELNADQSFSVAVVLAFLILNIQHISTRPTMFTIGLIFIQISCCEKIKKVWKYNPADMSRLRHSAKYIMCLLLISVMASNMHSCLWFMNFLAMIPYVLPSINSQNYKDSRKKDKIINLIRKPTSIPFLCITAGMVLVAFANPYGYRAITAIFASSLKELMDAGIQEMQYSRMLSIYSISTVAFLLFIAWKKELLSDVESEYIYMAAGLMLFGSMVVRNEVYGTAGMALMSFCLLQGKDFTQFHRFMNIQNAKVYVVMTVIVFLYGTYAFEHGNYKIKDSDATPVKAVEWLDDNAQKGDAVCTMFNGGSYIAWNGYKIYMECRTEGYFDKINGMEDIMAEYITLAGNLTKEYYEKFLDKYSFDYIITDDTMPGLKAMVESDDGMEMVVDGNGYRMYRCR